VIHTKPRTTIGNTASAPPLHTPHASTASPSPAKRTHVRALVRHAIAAIENPTS